MNGVHVRQRAPIVRDSRARHTYQSGLATPDTIESLPDCIELALMRLGAVHSALDWREPAKTARARLGRGLAWSGWQGNTRNSNLCAVVKPGHGHLHCFQNFARSHGYASAVDHEVPIGAMTIAESKVNQQFLNGIP